MYSLSTLTASFGRIRLFQYYDATFGGVRVRIYEPDDGVKFASKRAGIMFYHGGGWSVATANLAVPRMLNACRAKCANYWDMDTGFCGCACLSVKIMSQTCEQTMTSRLVLVVQSYIVITISYALHVKYVKKCS